MPDFDPFSTAWAQLRVGVSGDLTQPLSLAHAPRRKEQEMCRVKAGGVDRRQYGDVFLALKACAFEPPHRAITDRRPAAQSALSAQPCVHGNAE